MRTCGATTSDAYWSDHRCGLKKGHEKLPLDDINRSVQHQCHAAYWVNVQGKKVRVVAPCGFSWR